MTVSCDLCGSQSLQAAHRPDGTLRGLTVHVCDTCGLTQSLPRIDRAPRRDATISAGADWGNLRYGKGFRVNNHMTWLKETALPNAPRILDVGANRGAFIAAALTRWPEALITAIEPDTRVIHPYTDHPSVTLLHDRLEQTRLPDEEFNLVYSSHTLEHLAAPTQALRDHWRVLNPGGILLLEVPNIELIADADIVEEWFIDKHLYHFSPATLAFMAETAGFEILRRSPGSEHIHLTLALRRPESGADRARIDPQEPTRARARITTYLETRARNRAALRNVGAMLNARPGRTVIWGGGRLFDSLVLHGALDLARVAGLIDKNLSAHASARHGLPIRTQNDLPTIAPDTIFIASREFADEIAQEARHLVPEAALISYSDALDSVVGAPTVSDAAQEVFK